MIGAFTRYEEVYYAQRCVSHMKITNNKYYRNYEEIETLEAGISLLGSEVKQVKSGNLKLDNAFVKRLDDGLYLINAEIPQYKFAFPQGYDPRRSRRLLVHKREILRLETKMKRGGNTTLAPKSCYTKGQLIKIEVGLVRGRRDIEKKNLERKRDIARSQAFEAKEWTKQ